MVCASGDYCFARIFSLFALMFEDILHSLQNILKQALYIYLVFLLSLHFITERLYYFEILPVIYG